MSGLDKVLPSPQFCRDARWDPFRDWAPASLIFDQEFGSSPFLNMGENARRRLGSSSWPGYTLSRFFAPSAQALLHPSLRLLKQPCGALSEVRSGQEMWTISLDVNQFSPDEIVIKMKESFLEITGKHDEREDDHGFVTRCFTRKYNLPTNVDHDHIKSYLSGDGVLSVEIPLLTSGDLEPQKTAIPVQVGEKSSSLKEEGEEGVEKREETVPKLEGTSSEDKNTEVADPLPAPMQASGEDPELEEHPQQVPGVIPAASPEEQVGEQPAGAREIAAGPGEEQIPSEQTARTQDTVGASQTPEEQQSFGAKKDEVQQEARGQPEDPVEPSLAQGEQEGTIPEEAVPQTLEKPPAEDAEPVPSQSKEPQIPELEVQEKQDIEQAEEQPTKS